MKISGIKNSLIIFFIVITVLYCNSSFINAASKSSGATIIQFQATDGFNITGLLDIPKSASVKKKVPVVIFLHSLGRNKEDWRTFTNSVKSLGVATLSIDLRGHGQSILDKYNKKKYWPNFKDKEFNKYPSDINTGVRYLKENYPELNTNKVAIIGADVGANTAILAGSRSNRNIKTIVLLTPSTTFKKNDTRIPLAEYGAHPVLIIVSKNDRSAYYDAQDLIKYVQGKKQLKVYPFGGSGMDLLRFQPSSKTLILGWLKANFI